MGRTFILTKQMNPSLYDTVEKTSVDKRIGIPITYYSTENIRNVDKNLLQVDYGQYCKQIRSMLLRKGGDTMPLIKVLEHFPSTENYEVGETYDITNPTALIAEGKVELVDQPQEAPV